MLLMIWEGEVGAVGMTDNAAMGYYVIKWTSELCNLQAVTEGVSGVIAARVMVVDGLYFNMVGRAPYWYMQSELMMVVEVMYVLQSGLQMEEISATNKLPLTCNRLDTMRKKAVKISTQEHEAIMEEAGRWDRLDFSEDEDSDDVEDDESGSEVESDGNRK